MSVFLPDITVLTVLLLIIGFGLVFLEMHIPGFGVPGVVGAICLILAVVLTAQNFAQALVMALAILAVLRYYARCGSNVFSQKENYSSH